LRLFSDGILAIFQLEDALVAGKGLGEDVRRDQWRRRSARVVVAREEGRTEEGGKK